MLILPDRFDFLLEEVDVRADCKLGWPFEVLIVGPEVLDCGDVGYGMQTVLKFIFSLHEPLVPELKWVGEFEGLLLFLHNI